MLAAVCFAPLLKCMWFLELQIICAVHLAKPFGHYSLPRLRAIRRGTLCAVTSRGAHWQWGADSLALSQLSGPPLGQKPTQPYSRATGRCLHCHWWHWAGALSSAASRAFERYVLPKGTKPIVAYILGSQEKYLIAKCILRDQDMVYSLCKLEY